MSPMSEREVVRRLRAESGEGEPPAGLLARIESDIPPAIAISPRLTAAGDGARAAMRRGRWLLAASLVGAAGAGELGWLVMRSRLPAALPATQQESAPAGHAGGAAAMPPYAEAPAQPATRALLENGALPGTSAPRENGAAPGAGAARESRPTPSPRAEVPRPFAAPPAALIPEPVTAKRPTAFAPSPAQASQWREDAARERGEVEISAEAPLLDERAIAGSASAARAKTAASPAAAAANAAAAMAPPPPPTAAANAAAAMAAPSPPAAAAKAGAAGVHPSPPGEGTPPLEKQAAASAGGMRAGRLPAEADPSSYGAVVNDLSTIPTVPPAVPLGAADNVGLSAGVVRQGAGAEVLARLGRELGAGRLPAAGSVTPRDLVNAFDYGDRLPAAAGELSRASHAAAPAHPGVRLSAEGALAPADSAGRRARLRFSLRARSLAAGDRLRVAFSPALVRRYREAGTSGWTSSARPANLETSRGTAPAGDGVASSWLFEVELAGGAAATGAGGPQLELATFVLFREPGGSGASHTLHVAELAPAWQGASVNLRVAFLAADFATSLAGAGDEAAAAGIAARARALAAAFPGDPRPAELARLTASAAALKQKAATQP